MPKGTLPLSETVATLARSASAMHDAMVALAIEDPDDRMASTGMAEATLARVVIESLVTGLWLMLLDDDLTRQRRYVSQVLNDLDDEHRILRDGYRQCEGEQPEEGVPSSGTPGKHRNRKAALALRSGTRHKGLSGRAAVLGLGARSLLGCKRRAPQRARRVRRPLWAHHEDA